MKKRIALFSIAYDPFIGGAEVAIKEITNRLPKHRFDLYTAKLDPTLPDEEKIGNIYVYRVGIGRRWFDKLFFAWGASRLALKNHQKRPYSVFHAIMANYAGLAALLCKKKTQNVSYVLTLQSGDSDWFIRMRTWFWYPWYKQIYTKADRITAISNWLVDRAKRYGYKGEIVLIPNGVDTELFGIVLSDEGRLSIRAQWGVQENDYVVITTSRLVHKNAIDVLINAMKKVPENVYLVIAGTGKDEHKLKEQSKKFKERVLFIGQVVHADLPVLLQSADIFARPSRTEGMGISFIEAMASGTPVVATPVGGIVDFVEHEKTGMLIAVDNPESVGNAITTLIQNTALRTRISTAAKTVVAERYTWDRIVRDYDSIYTTIETNV